MRLNHREADRFQHALQGGPITDAAIADLIERSRDLVAVGAYAGTPRPEFVGALRERLVNEAAALSRTETTPRAVATRTTRSTPSRANPLVVVIGRGLPRMVAGLTASLLAVGGVVGAASQSSLPGGALYPVRGLLDGVAVQLAGSQFDRGVTMLSQARDHVADSREMSSRGEDDPRLFVEALTSARTSVAAAQTALSTSFSENSSAQAPIQMVDFVVAISPQLEASRTELPGPALGSLAALQAELADVQVAWTTQLTACAPTCVSGADAQGLLDVLGLQDLSEIAPGSTPGPVKVDPVVDPDSSDGVLVPGAGVTGPAVEETSETPSSGSDGAGTSGAGSGGPPDTGAGNPADGSTGTKAAGVPGGGGAVDDDGVAGGTPTVSVPAVKGAPASVPLPSVTAGPAGVGVDLPKQNLGGVVLPGLGVSVPLAPTKSTSASTGPAATTTQRPVLRILPLN